MFFFIGGIQPKTIELDKNLKLCPSCGLYQARLKRIDHYISIFFLPLLRVKKGKPFMICERCGAVSSMDNNEAPHIRDKWQSRCPNCGVMIEQGFKFCPFCGSRL